MTRTRALPVALALLALTARAAPAQSPHDLFQQALVQEHAYGNLDAALRLYQRIADEFAHDRPLVARVLVQLGGVYHKLGREGARAAYRRVTREFSDQRDLARVARERLAALPARDGNLRADPTHTLLFDGLRVDEPGEPAPYDVSPDGQRLVFVDRRTEGSRPGLYLWDRRGERVHPLVVATDETGAIEGLWSPRWSPDGERVAFTARLPRRDELRGLYVVTVATRALDRLGDSFDADLCWTPDGAAVMHGIRPGGRLRPHPVRGARDWASVGDPLPRNTLLGGYSPDGQWIALDIRTERLGREMRDIWIQPADGGARFHVTDSPGMDATPTWGSDGSLYFVSDRGGSPNIWRLARDAIAGGQAPPARMRGDPPGARGRLSRLDVPRLGVPEEVTFFRRARVAYPRRAGADGLAFVLQRVTNTIHVADAARPSASRVLVRGTTPQPSPDGRAVFFWGDEPGRTGIFVVPSGGGEPRRLTTGTTPDHPLASWFHLSPDGTAIAYTDDAERDRAVVVLPAAGGTARRLAALSRGDPVVPRWSPDGARLAFASGGGLYVMDRAGGAPVEVARLRRWDGWSVRWSPDGEYLAALGWEHGGGVVETQNHVFVVPAAGGEPRRLTPDGERQYKQGLEWRPDGRALTYMYQASDFEGDGLRTAYLDGRPSTPFLDEPDTWDYVGTWAPDGSAYYFMASRGDRSGWQLYRRDTASGAVSEIAAGDGVTLPRWSRDGATMAWSVERVVSQVWVMER